MQVDPKPSPWPCVVMLVGLLLFCLTVPCYWESTDSPDDSLGADSIGLAEDAVTGLKPDWIFGDLPSGLSAIRNGALGIVAGTPSDTRLLTLFPPPTIEELVESTRVGSPGFDANVGAREPYSAGWPVILPPYAPAEPRGSTADLAGAPVAMPNPLVTMAMERVGRALAVYSFADAMPQLISRAADFYHEWTAERTAYRAPSPSASTLRLIGPDDRLAMRPPAAERVPVTAPTAAPDQTTDQPAADPWCVPQALYKQLERLARHPYSASWAQATIAQLHAITERDPLDSGELPMLLLDLSRSAQSAARLAEETGDDRLRVELLRAHWGLARRLDCWTVMHDIRIAERAGTRIASRGSLNSLFDDAHRQGVERTDGPALNSDLESYEQSRDPQLGRQVAQEHQALRSSGDSLDQSLAEAVEQHYRNANVRVAITAAMLNRLVGEQRSEVRPVRERIAGTPVRGQSHTVSDSRIHLQPTTGHWHLDLEAQGVVESNTLANGGRARLRSFGATDFTARKTIVVDTDGVKLEQTVVGASNHNRLAGVTTDFDWVPLLGSYARSQAVKQYRAKRPRAKAEVEYKVAAQAMDQMDRETREAVDRVEREVRERFTDPMAHFGVELTPIELTTTHERIVARLRVAGNHQLGAHTPRPRALSDSLASVQIHETALTNAAVSLGLDGSRFTAPELQLALREKFPGLAADDPLEARHDTAFNFDYRDAVQFRIEGGRLELVLAVASLELQGKEINNFIVHAFYVPVVDGLNAELVRDGALGFEGRLSATERARLHNVFSSVFSQERRLPVARLEQLNDQRLDGLTITQFVLEDGWIGLAVGPGDRSRVAERSRSLR